MSGPYTPESPMWQGVCCGDRPLMHGQEPGRGAQQIPQPRIAQTVVWCDMLRTTLILLALAISPAMAQTVKPDCACLNRDGVEVPLGQIACLTVSGRSFTARCASSQNVLTWRKLHDGCLSAQITPIPAS